MTKKVLDNVGLTYFWGKIKSAFASKVPSATDGNLAGLDSSGNLTDSGIDADDVITKAELAVPITYAVLKALRDGGNLTSGVNYRITDYTCTTTKYDTQSAGHVFDIIVRADDESHLNENAFAAHHDGDTYFANCKLESWKLKYSLDNDTDRFDWADTTNGKGVVFYMKDEWNNECPYDFKNIQFKRYEITACNACPRIAVSDEENYGYYYGIKERFTEDGQTYEEYGLHGEEATYGTNYAWAYTFSLLKSSNPVVYVDFSVDNYHVLEWDVIGCINNTIKACDMPYVMPNSSASAYMLNNIVLFSCYLEEAGRYDAVTNNFFDYNNSEMSIAYPSYNTFDVSNNGWIIGECSSSKFGRSGGFSLSDRIYECVIGASYFHNIISGLDGCVIGDRFQNNTTNNKGSKYMGVVKYCTIGNNCIGNNFGYIYGSEIGDCCTNNSFAAGVFFLKMFPNVIYCNINGKTNTSYSNPIKNVQILSDVKGTSSQRIDISLDVNQSYTQVVSKGSGGSLKIWVAADKQDTISDLATIRSGAALGATSIQSSEKGAASGVATLDSGGRVPQSQLPSYVDDVLEYANLASFPATGESGKIYVALDTNKTYRWGGSAYVEISQSLALGETSSTAFSGYRGKAIEDKIPSSASSSNKLATASDVSAKSTVTFRQW